MTTFETGATSHAVNELILFTDTTRELAELRDSIYKRAFSSDDIIGAHFRVEGQISGINSLKKGFVRLLIIAIDKYKEEFPNDCDHIIKIKHFNKEGQEFCELYTQRFENWKKENGY